MGVSEILFFGLGFQRLRGQWLSGVGLMAVGFRASRLRM